MSFALATVPGIAAPALADQVVDGRTGPGSAYRLVVWSEYGVKPTP